jgi:hypothetical protein
MEYLIILPTEELTSKERANLITRELYNVTAPVAKQFDYQANGKVFPVLAHPDNPQPVIELDPETGEVISETIPTEGQYALQVDTGFVIYCSPEVDLSRLVSAFPEVPAEEKAGLEALIENSTSITFGQIIPSTAIIRDHQYMVDHGWFPEPETI